MSDLGEICLKKHNEYRAQHGAGPLTLKKELMDFAQKQAEKMAKKQKLSHSSHDERKAIIDGKYVGENIAYSWAMPARPADGEKPVIDWYSEIKDYNYSTPETNSNTGHFTQVVWKSSTHLGFGYAQGDDKAWYYCCNYLPGGNYKGQYADNVAPKK